MRAVRIGILATAALVAVGCGGRYAAPTADRATPGSRPAPERDDAPAAEDERRHGGVFHVVEPGQTLWRIARAYGIEVETLEAVNDIEDVRDIAVGTRLWIPGASRTLVIAAAPVAPTPPGDRIAVDTGRFLRPVGGALLSGFGAPRGDRTHRGIDLKGRSGDPIRAADAGTVAFAGTMRGYGRVVMIDHRGGWRSVYAHNESNLVRQGDRVERGTVIARVGRSGNATTAHCHFELRRDDIAVDPMPFFEGAGSTERTSRP